jgi:gamma-glutamyltranspeptidase
MGIGGGHFMVVYLKEKKYSFAIDARETAPFASSENMFVDKPNLSLKGFVG